MSVTTKVIYLTLRRLLYTLFRNYTNLTLEPKGTGFVNPWIAKCLKWLRLTAFDGKDGEVVDGVGFPVQRLGSADDPTESVHIEETFQVSVSVDGIPVRKTRSVHFTFYIQLLQLYCKFNPSCTFTSAAELLHTRETEAHSDLIIRNAVLSLSAQHWSSPFNTHRIVFLEKHYNFN